MKDVKIRNCFISSRSELYFNLDQQHNLGASFVTQVPLDKNSLRVRAVTLDSLAQDEQRVSLLKIDVERHELEVLESSQRLLQVAKPEICIEAFQLSRADLNSYLARFSYLPIADLPNGNSYYVIFPVWFVQLVLLIAKGFPKSLSSRCCWRLVKILGSITGRTKDVEFATTPSYVFL